MPQALLSVTESQLFTDLRAFLLDILPAGVEVIQGQDNRVPEPEAPDFVVMTPTWRGPLATIIDNTADCTFTGEITDLALTASAVTGTINPGTLAFGPNLPLLGATIVAQVSGAPGGAGVYAMAPGTPDASSGACAAGVLQAKQETQVTAQLDVHGPNSADNRQIITTLFWNEWACEFFKALGHGVQPLYADDKGQMPFVNDQQQVENRWVILAELQVNPVVTVAQQFAQKLTVGLIEVDTTYPP
jgi:hypothetical protein